jgi:opacity protein-like surface antigen
MSLKIAGAVATAAVASVVALSAPHAARATDCLVDEKGSSQYGSMSYGTEVYLLRASIHTSLWDANSDYFARRYDSAFNLTLNNYVLSGSYVYGTSGNVVRQTAMTPGDSAGLSYWFEDESTMC